MTEVHLKALGGKYIAAHLSEEVPGRSSHHSLINETRHDAQHAPFSKRNGIVVLRRTGSDRSPASEVAAANLEKCLSLIARQR